MKIVINTAENGYVVEKIEPNGRGGNSHCFYVANAIWELRDIVVNLCEQDHDQDPD